MPSFQPTRDWWPFSANPVTGKRTFFRCTEPGQWEFKYEQDCEPILERNKALANHETNRAGYSPSKDFRRIGSIPAVIILKWLNEDGINVFDPNHQDAVLRKLRDPEWRYLRTALWNI